MELQDVREPSEGGNQGTSFDAAIIKQESKLTSKLTESFGLNNNDVIYEKYHTLRNDMVKSLEGEGLLSGSGLTHKSTTCTVSAKKDNSILQWTFTNPIRLGAVPTQISGVVSLHSMLLNFYSK